jgi:preprotein translocase subunit SecG
VRESPRLSSRGAAHETAAAHLGGPVRRRDVTAVRITLEVLLVLTSLFLTLLILLHKGRGGGLSDMFRRRGSRPASGVPASPNGTSTGFTIAVGIIWVAVIVLLNLLNKFTTFT